jgi:tetratricopeptide (TPR) repeat protein
MRATSFVLAVALAGLLPVTAGAQTVRRDTGVTAGYYFLLGRHLEANGRIEAAISAHQKAIGLDPESAELRAELAGLYARQDRAVEALEAAESALARDPANHEANRVLGSVYAAFANARQPLRPGEDPRQYPARAAAALEKARRDGPVDLAIDLMLGRLYLQTKDYTKAISVLRRVLYEQPGYSDAALLLADAQESAGDAAAAIETLRTTIDANPRFYRGLVRLGELSEKRGEWLQAADAFARAQRLLDRGPDLTPRRAAALINGGRAEEAGNLLRAAAAEPEADASVLYLFAIAQRQAGDLAAAEGAARRLRVTAPDDPRGLYVLAQVLDAKGDREGAERTLRDMIQRDPLDAAALNYLGYMFAERGERLDEAVELVGRALRVEPDNPSFLDSLGWAYFQQGKIELADSPLTRAAEKLPNSSVVQDHLGDLRFKQGRVAEAVEAWERSLKGDGDSIDRAAIEKKIRDARAR